MRQSFLFGLILVLGCASKDDDTKTTSAPPRLSATLAAGTRVVMVADHGEFAEVRDEQDRRWFVPGGRLQQRSQADGDADGTHTHFLSAAVPAFDSGPPETLPDEPSRPARDILLEQLTLNGLYLTEDTLVEVVAPAGSEPKFQGQRCWPARYCTNPDCPAKDQGKNGRPYLFIKPIANLPKYTPGKPHPVYGDTYCPACQKLWKDQADDENVKRRYRNYVRPYQLPEAERRIRELDRERRRGAEKR